MRVLLAFCVIVPSLLASRARADESRAGPPSARIQHLLYVASPGVRDYTRWGGHGVLVFDIDAGHGFLRRISLAGHGVDDAGKVLNVKGVCASAATGRLWLSTLRHLIAIDLVTEKVLYERSFDLGCDRMAVSPDGRWIYLPSLENDCWYVVDAVKGDEVSRVWPRSGAHNTVYGRDGKHVYLAGLRSPLLGVAATDGHTLARTIGPFSAPVRPFTINAAQTLAFVNVNELLGFEVGDLRTGAKLWRVEVEGFPLGKPDRHGCPSHGIGLTPDENEVWVCDGFNRRLHIFDARAKPPKQIHSVALREQPGWVTFSIDGVHAYASTGEVIDTKSRKIVAALADEEGREVHSEKLLEVQFVDGKPIATGDQFGIGRAAR